MSVGFNNYFRNRSRINVIFLMLFCTLGCSKVQINAEELYQNSAVWKMTTKDPANSNALKTTFLQFNKNGYVYERNSILKYPYKIHHEAGIFELNHQNFKILSFKQNRLLLLNSGSGIQVELVKE